MRLLTVSQPTAALLTVPGLHGKPVVNRRFPASYRGRLVIVAGALDRSLLGDPMLASTIADSGLAVDELPINGEIVGTAILADAHQSAGACCAPWGNTGRAWFHLVLDDVRPVTRSARLPTRPGLTGLDPQEYAKVLTCL